jgi:S-methylmethionine-dependent homocysteine/selenocysteine methylase
MTLTLLDGGMGQELVARAGKATSLWSVQALLDNPETVRAVHRSYFNAGADVATTNTYAILPDRLAPKGLTGRLADLMQLACRLTCEARDAHGAGLVAGGLGPQGFSYQPDKSPPAEQAAEVYAVCARLQVPFVDLHILETMSSLDQARGGLMGASVTGKPIWLALSVDDADGTKLRSGEPLIDVASLLVEYQPAAVLLNCSVPEAIDAALPVLATMGHKFGAYANGFTAIADTFDHIGATVDLLQARTDLGPVAYAKFADSWAQQGASIIGGCCQVGPAHIAELRRRFDLLAA